MKKAKLWVYNLIGDDEEKDWKSNLFDGIIITLIMINVIQVVVSTFPLSKSVTRIFSYIELISVIIFTLEYFARVWTSTYIYPNLSPVRARIRYMVSFMAIIDLLAILPFYIPFIIPIDLRVLRALRALRLLRLFKMNRYTKALHTIAAVLKNRAAQLISSIFVVMLLMLIAAVLMYNVENEAQPDVFNNAFDALWWAVATFTTVGYGDIYPITSMGKILAAIIAILGIGMVAVPTGIISAGFMEEVGSAEKAEADNLDMIERLFEMKNQGIISEEEFGIKKRELLGIK